LQTSTLHHKVPSYTYVQSVSSVDVGTNAESMTAANQSESVASTSILTTVE